MSNLLDAIRKAAAPVAQAEGGGRKAEVGGQKSAVRGRPTSDIRRPISGRKDLRGCSGCRKKMLAKMRAKRGLADDKEPHT